MSVSNPSTSIREIDRCVRTREDARYRVSNQKYFGYNTYMRYLITYPRSGTTWTIRRGKALFDLFEQRPGGFVHGRPRAKNSHLGFHPSAGPDGTGGRLKLIRDGYKLSILMRDARQAVPSNFFWLMKNVAADEPKRFIKRYGPCDVNKFSVGEWGIERFVRYLQRVQDYKEKHPMTFYFYEDIDTREFVYELPKIFGDKYMNLVPTEEEVELVYNAGKMKVNLVGADHSLVTQETLDYMQDYLKEHCPLPEYRERYLED